MFHHSALRDGSYAGSAGLSVRPEECLFLLEWTTTTSAMVGLPLAYFLVHFFLAGNAEKGIRLVCAIHKEGLCFAENGCHIPSAEFDYLQVGMQHNGF